MLAVSSRERARRSPRARAHDLSPASRVLKNPVRLLGVRSTERSNHSADTAMTKSKITSPAPPPGEVTQVVDHFFRHESGKMISTLTRVFGVEHLNRAEDVVQETLVRALQTWPYYGIPKNPAAWITQVAKNLALDLIRRDKIFRNKEIEITRLMEQGCADSTGENSAFAERNINDDRLRMMLVCCHPRVPQEAQVALALKTLCGFSAADCPGVPHV